MANICSLAMRITGSGKRDVEEVIGRLYDVAANGGRGLYEYTSDGVVVGSDGSAYANVYGSCPWSIDAAFGLSGGLLVRRKQDCGIVRESRSLNLLVEVYGRESVLGFDDEGALRKPVLLEMQKYGFTALRV